MRMLSEYMIRQILLLYRILLPCHQPTTSPTSKRRHGAHISIACPQDFSPVHQEFAMLAYASTLDEISMEFNGRADAQAVHLFSFDVDTEKSLLTLMVRCDP